MIRHYYRMRLRDPRQWGIFALLAGCSLLLAALSQMQNIQIHAPAAGAAAAFQAGMNAVWGVQPMVFYEIPIYLVFLLFSQKIFLRTAVQARFSSQRSFWGHWFLATAADAGIYTGVLYALLLFRFLLSGQAGALQGRGEALAQSAVLQFLTLLLMGVLFSALNFLTRRTVVGFLAVYLMALSDFVVSNVSDGNGPFPVFFLKTLCPYPYFLSAFAQSAILLAGILAAALLVLPVLSDSMDSLQKEAV